MAAEEKLRTYLKRATIELADARRQLAEYEAIGDEPIAIVGMACRYPGADTSQEYWDLLQEGRSPVMEDVPGDRFDLTPYIDRHGVYTRRGAFLDDITGWDADFFGVSPREAMRMDPQQRLLMELAWETIESTGISASALAGSRTGVLVGFSDSLQYGRLQGDREGIRVVTDPFLGQGSAASVVAGRLAYHFDLRGPTMTLDTACSSSLVAVHLAMAALRRGECDVALAGGGFLAVHPDIYATGCATSMLSPEGLCKTFDANADGYLLGEGGGMVALTRLSDAIRSGHRIRAVIRGSAVNQDGRSNGLTAPSRSAQVDVIRRALASAKVHPDEVAFVEAHGSGTALGDAIELGALNDVFGGRSTRNPLQVGAVKTNIGHTQAAAGVAGLIKTVLVLEHGVVPPNLHMKEPNAAVLASETVRPADTLLRLPATDRPRIAGVSSFGWSGTNAHLVLEAAPVPSTNDAPAVGPDVRPEAVRRYEVLPVSAHSAAAADEACRRLGEHLAKTADALLPSVAYSLQTGRRTFEHRRAVVVADGAEAVASLGGAAGAAPVLTRADAVQDRRVAFLLAGVGEQYPGMVGDLYRREPVFREHLDGCLGVLSGLLPGVDVVDLLTGTRSGGPDLAALLGRVETADPRSAVLERTEVVQPLVFAVDYALARTLMTWGLKPEVMLGYSLGEYVAACLAGVLSLEDALRLVAHRAKLIEGAEPGAMAAVPLSADELRHRFALDERGLDIAAVNAPQAVVVSGPGEAVHRLMEDLRAAEIPTRPLQTTHAFHSRMLAPLADELTRWIASHITLNRPSLPYLSNVTGRLADEASVCDPAYWARHMCEPVRFEDGAAALRDESDLAVVEIGPGQSLGALLRAAGFPPERWPLITSVLPAASDARPADLVLTDCLARLWLIGTRLDWRAYHADRPAGAPRLVQLPEYPFQRQRYWVEAGTSEGLGTQDAPPRPTSLEDITRIPRLPEEDWLHLPVWRQTSPLAAAEEQPGAWLVYSDDGAADRVLAELREAVAPSGAMITVVRPGTSYARTEEGWTVRPGSVEDAVGLLRALRADGVRPERVVHLWAMDAAVDDEDAILSRGLHSLLALVRAAGELTLDGWALDVVTSGAQRVLDTDEVRPAVATVTGPVLVVPQEHPSVRTRMIDIGFRTTAAEVTAELRRPRTGSVVALRSGRRWTREYETLPPVAPAEVTAELRDRGVYLITGGLGGIGLGMAKHLAQDCRARLVLFGRRGLPARERWDAIASGREETDETTRERVSQVLEIIALGGEVEVVEGDVSDSDAVRRAIDAAYERYGALNGLLHTAGVAGSGLLQFKKNEDIARVLAPKIGGVRAIAEALRIGRQDERVLDFLVLFSSITSATGGGPGQADYCAANAYLDGFAGSVGTAGTRVLAVNWGEWTWNAWESGMDAYDQELKAFFHKHRVEVGITIEEGWRSLLRALATPEPQVLVSTQDLATMVRFSNWYNVDALTSSAGPGNSGIRYPRPELMMPYQEPAGPVEEQIAAVWCEALSLERVGVNDNFFELGGNSLLGIRLVATLRSEFGETDLPPHVLYEAPTVSSLARAVERLMQGPSPSANDSGGEDRARLRQSALKAAARRRR